MVLTVTAADVEVTVRMLNVNYGHNKKLLEACMPLHDYSLFIAKTREFQANYSLEVAIDLAIEALPAGSKIREFLEAHRSEVKRMYLTEYDEAEHLKLIELEKKREIEEIQQTDATAVTTALRLLREGATTVKELTDQGVPEKIAQAFIADQSLSDEGKRGKNE